MVAPFEIRPFNEILGAEVLGFDMRVPLDDADFDTVSKAFDRHSVLVFRNQQRLDPASHIAFSRRFGPLEIHVQRKFLLEGHPELLIVSNEFRDGEPIGLVDAGKYWHSDLSYKQEPSMGSLLHSRTLPPEGGDTLFATQHAAYDALPAAMQAKLDRLTAEHSYLARNEAQRAKSALRPDLTDEQKQTVLPTIHPVVRVHPGTGRKALFVSEGFTTHIVELPEDESRDLLAEIYAHQTQPPFIYRHHWADGDLVMWDNRAVMHLATGCPPDMARTLYRTTIRGPVPVGPVA
ncbi:MAG TPA: TauD/TfdA family dioxygenase [Aliidongia sp.]|uniref:TauD/TfdA dioxygenase family protein n=1 Tax=Aliidongia sp. TaxID=1914230 RepID=UPI002DDD0A5D|nr:TauD/TfdA family dioxygenase [Aliidongia sp.]HEV2676229.1 TauD/TfdA family dioxygenase [Aliidongia sp.]